MDQLILTLEKLPVATVIIVVLAIVGGVDLVIDGQLSADFEHYAAIVGGSAGLLGIGRGIQKQNKPAA